MFRQQIRHLHENRRRAHPSRASGMNCEAIPGPAQFKLRTHQAMAHVMGAECSTAIGIPAQVALGG
eukprot:182832-Alexandrium_andersonii.AAC.1